MPTGEFFMSAGPSKARSTTRLSTSSNSTMPRHKETHAKAENESGNHGDRDQPSTPSLLIPYWNPGDRGPTDPGDRGDIRPVPSGIVQYLCQGITTAAPYQPG